MSEFEEIPGQDDWHTDLYSTESEEDTMETVSKPDHICGIDCQLVYSSILQAHIHQMYPAEPNTAAGRYQYDRNQEIYRMGKGARAAMRATGQPDTRTNREWKYARGAFRQAVVLASAEGDRMYREDMTSKFGDRRPFVKRSIRSMARQAALRELLRPKAWDPTPNPWDPAPTSSQAGLASFVRPSYLPGSEHDPNL